MKVPKANAQSLIHFPLLILGEIIEKTNQSLKITNNMNIINRINPGNDGIRFPNKIIKYSKMPLESELRINVIISFFIFLFIFLFLSLYASEIFIVNPITVIDLIFFAFYWKNKWVVGVFGFLKINAN